MAAAIAMAIIDGTGPLSESDYANDFKFSFCKQLADQLGGSAHYEQGPWFHGLNDAWKMYRAIDWLTAARQRNASVRLMLAGYSRGAATVSAAAYKMRSSGVQIDSMFLFDAVARHLLAFGRTVENTQYCAHAMRSQDDAFVMKYEPEAYDEYGNRTINPLLSNPTRPFFGGCCHTAGAGVQFVPQTFTGSHGALGGVGWKKVTEDGPAQAAVAGWMNKQLQLRGVPATLVSHPPTA